MLICCNIKKTAFLLDFLFFNPNHLTHLLDLYYIKLFLRHLFYLINIFIVYLILFNILQLFKTIAYTFFNIKVSRYYNCT